MNSMIENSSCNTGNETIDNLAQSFFIGLFFCTLLGDSYLYVQQFSKTPFMKKQLKKVKNITEAVSCVFFKKYKEEDGNIVIESPIQDKKNDNDVKEDDDSITDNNQQEETEVSAKYMNDLEQSIDNVNKNSSENINLQTDSQNIFVSTQKKLEVELSSDHCSISNQEKEQIIESLEIIPEDESSNLNNTSKKQEGSQKKQNKKIPKNKDTTKYKKSKSSNH